MPNISILPFLFILLWSSAFISGKAIMADATPFAALLFRFCVVTFGFGVVCLLVRQSFQLSVRKIMDAIFIGVLFHGIYLGGVFWSMSHHMPAGSAALIVSLQPVLTALLAGPLLAEHVSMRQWIGTALGFLGAAMVLGVDVGTVIPVSGVIVCLFSLAAITGGTLYQKRHGSDVPVLISNFYQGIGGVSFHLCLMLLIEDPYIHLTTNFIIGMSWQILAVSAGAWLILLILLKQGTASKTTALFFLVPPTAAIMGYIVLAEPLTAFDISGLCLASFGVFIATRPQRPPAAR